MSHTLLKKMTVAALALGASLCAVAQDAATAGFVRKTRTHGHQRTSAMMPSGFQPVPVMTRTPGEVPVFAGGIAAKAVTSTPAPAAAPSRSNAGPDVPLYAVVLSSTQWASYNDAVGVYRLPIDGTVPTRLEAEFLPDRPTTLYANGGACYGDGKLFATNYVVYDNTILPSTYTYDTDTWTLLNEVDGDLTSMATAMTYDPLTEQIYGCFYSVAGLQMNFGILNVNTGKSEAITRIDDRWNACAVSPEGVLYAIGMSGDLYTVEKTTGAMTRVGSTGLTPQYLSGAAFNPFTGKLYYVCTPGIDNSKLYEIDPATGAATFLYSLPGGEQVAGIFVPQLAASVEAPAAPTSLAVTFAGASLTGTVSFTAPSVTFGGETLTGELDYHLIVDGLQYAIGQVNPGESVTVNVTVAKAGTHDFAVFTENEAGAGAKVREVLYVGNDAMPSVKNVVLESDGTNFCLKWDPITKGQHGGYIDLDRVSYTVTRFPGETVVAQGLKTPAFTEPLPSLDGGAASFHYTVQAFLGETPTEAVASNPVVLGALSTPYYEPFNQGCDISTYTIIDANNDSKTWAYYWLNGYTDGRMRAIYNTNQEMDDWLITPPVYLEGGKRYEFSFNAGGYNASNTERFEVKYGTAPTVDGMANTLIEPTEVTTATTADKVLQNAFFVPEADGVYYIGIHGISDKNKFYLFADDIRISAPMSADTPLAVTDLNVKADWGGDLQAKITFITPVKTAAGNAITTLDKVEIARDGRVIATLENLQAGKLTAYVDTDEQLTNGLHTYTVTPYNEAGAGNPLAAEVFVGINAPSTPLWMTAALTENEGEVHLEWQGADVDIDGRPINPELVTFRLLTTNEDGNIIVLKDNYEGTEYTYNAVAAGHQRMMTFAVIALTEMGTSPGVAETDIVAVGTPYAMPLQESFPRRSPAIACGMLQYDDEPYSSWGYYSDSSFDDSGLSFAVKSQDGDDGFIGYTAKAIGGVSAFLTGRVAVNRQDHPIFTFWHLVTHEEDPNLIEVLIRPDGSQPVIAKSITGYENPTVGQWEKITVALDDFAGQNVMFEIRVTCKGYAREFFDNLAVVNDLDRNLHARGFEGSSILKLGNNNLRLAVENIGRMDSGDFSVDLYRDGTLVATKDADAIAAGQTGYVIFPQECTIFDNETITFQAVVYWADDQATADNTTPEWVATVTLPTFPVASNLNGEHLDADYILTWDAVDAIHTTPVSFTDDFESYTPWAISEVGDWNLYDGDGHMPGAMENFELPFGRVPTSFFVFDNTDQAIPESYRQGFASYSGKQFMSNIFPYGDTGSTVDDWMISPLLTGEAQTISFFARSYNSAWAESFEFLASWDGNDPEDPDNFELIKRYNYIPMEWKEYTFDLPEGAKYFAIRCVSYNAFMMFVDNVTMRKADGPVELSTLRGYNIYRNGVKLTDTPVTDTRYAIPAETADGASFVVTSVYNRGESVPSQAHIGQLLGLDAATADAVSVTADHGVIRILGATGLSATVVAPDGTTLAAIAACTPAETIAAPAGVYLVTVAGCTTKLLVP